MNVVELGHERSRRQMATVIRSAITCFDQPDEDGFRIPDGRLTIRRMVKGHSSSEPSSASVSYGRLYDVFHPYRLLTLGAVREAAWEFHRITFTAYDLPTGERIYTASRSSCDSADYVLASTSRRPVHEADGLFLRKLFATNGWSYGLELLDGLSVPTQIQSLYEITASDLGHLVGLALDSLGDHAWANLFHPYQGLWTDEIEPGSRFLTDDRATDRLKRMFMLGYSGPLGPQQMIVGHRFRQWVGRYACWVGEDHLLSNLARVAEEGPFWPSARERVAESYAERVLWATRSAERGQPQWHDDSV